jgi:hypothetical protein
VLFRDPSCPRFTAHKEQRPFVLASHNAKKYILTSRTHLPHRLSYKIPLKIPSQPHNSPATTRKRRVNLKPPGPLLATPRTRTPGTRIQDQNAQETPKNNGQHALNSRSPLVASSAITKSLKHHRRLSSDIDKLMRRQ